MNFIKTFVAVSALSLFSAASFAQSVSATASTLDARKLKLPPRPQNRVHPIKLPAPSLTTVFI